MFRVPSSALSARRTSIPDIFGMSMSRRIRSGGAREAQSFFSVGRRDQSEALSLEACFARPPQEPIVFDEKDALSTHCHCFTSPLEV